MICGQGINLSRNIYDPVVKARGLETEETRQNYAMRVILGRCDLPSPVSPPLFTRQYKPLKNLSNFFSSSRSRRRRRTEDGRGRAQRMKTPPWNSSSGADERRLTRQKSSQCRTRSLSRRISLPQFFTRSASFSYRQSPQSPTLLRSVQCRRYDCFLIASGDKKEREKRERKKEGKSDLLLRLKFYP